MSPMSIFCFFFPGHGLKCYECGSTKDWDSCDSVRKEVTCDPNEDRCVKRMKEGTQDDVSFTVYYKGCVQSSECDAADTADFCKTDKGESGEIKKCDNKCCSGDLCNGGKVPMVSAIMLLACALVAFLR